MNKYTLIHPTKSGGTSLEDYFDKHYSEYVVGLGHGNKCKNNNNPIIVVRDVKSRFFSMYKYWKNGSSDTKFKRSESWKKKHKDVSIIDFINILKNNKKTLYKGFTWDKHFENTAKWIEKDTEYKNIIIIMYEPDLNSKVQTLINLLGIPNKNVPLPIKNVSVSVNNDDELINEEVDNFLAEYFKDDINLINKINNNPQLFKMVI